MSAAPLPGSFLGRLAQSELPRRILGAMISIFVPGAGHVILGYQRLGWIVAAVSLVLGAGFVGCVMTVATSGFLVFGAAYILCTVASVLSIFALRPGPELKKGLIALWPVFVLFVVFRGAAYLVQGYAFDALQMPSMAMAPMIGTGDIVFVTKRGYVPRLGDVVVVEAPEGPLLRRVVAIGGQHVQFDDHDTLSVDGHAVTDVADGVVVARDVGADGKPGAEHQLARNIESNGDVRYAVVLGKARVPAISEHTLAGNELVVMSDNRSESSEAHRAGLVTDATVRGKALFVFMAGPSLKGPGRIWTPLSAK
jgi:signal peptidase I